MAFSAVHGWLGALVVPALTDGPVAEICTPQGVQWVALNAVGTAVPDGGGQPEWPQGLAKPCAWSMAHVTVPLPPLAEGCVLPHQAPVQQGQGWSHTPGEHGHDLPVRVLLMAAMRAPPSA
jgi:hypothetical protein